MDDEEVVMAQVKEEGPQEEYQTGRRITAGPIIAVVVLVIILSGIGLYMFSGSVVRDILILDPQNVSTGDDERYGIEVEIHITSGMKAVDGTGKLEVIYDGSIVHTKDVRIRDDAGSTIINYRDFVLENGIYDIRFSMGGKSATTTYTARMVPDNLNISIQYRTDRDTGGERTMAVVSPEFTYPDGVGDSVFYYSSHYRLETTLTPPDGDPIITDKSMWEYHKNKTYTKVWIPIEGDYMGYYAFSARLTNELVKDSSPYKILTSDPEELVKYLNKKPVLGDISAPSRIRQGQEATFTLRASDPDVNGGIDYYTVDWNLDDETDELQFIDVHGGPSTVKVKHSYDTTGTYNILITVADNGLIDESDTAKNFKQFDSTRIQVVVTLI